MLCINSLNSRANPLRKELLLSHFREEEAEAPGGPWPAWGHTSSVLPCPPSFPLTRLGCCPGLRGPRARDVSFRILPPPPATTVTLVDIPAVSLLSLPSPRACGLLAPPVIPDPCLTPGSGAPKKKHVPSGPSRPPRKALRPNPRKHRAVETWARKQRQNRHRHQLTFKKGFWKYDKRQRGSDGGRRRERGRFEQLLPGSPSESKRPVPAAPLNDDPGENRSSHRVRNRDACAEAQGPGVALRTGRRRCPRAGANTGPHAVRSPGAVRHHGGEGLTGWAGRENAHSFLLSPPPARPPRTVHGSVPWAWRLWSLRTSVAGLVVGKFLVLVF